MTTFSLSKKEQLSSRYEFKNVYQRRRVKKHEFFWIYSAPNGEGINRLGLSISKRFCKNNVQRNKIKRLIRQYFQLNKADFGQKTDSVFVLKKAPKELTYKKISRIIDKLLKTP